MSLIYSSMSRQALESVMSESKAVYDGYVSQKLKLNMSRGRPCAEQLDLTRDMLSVIGPDSDFAASSLDVRNYGGLTGIDEIKDIFAPIIGAEKDEIIAAGNSSLNLMYDLVADGMLYGYSESTPWTAQSKRIKFICPAPGYDRHFAICEMLGIEMLTVKMNSDGPDMDEVCSLCENDESIKGIWCVPKYSNPTGVTFSDNVVRRFAEMSPKAKDFRIFWDNSYVIHDLNAESDHLLNLFDELKVRGKEDELFMFTSTSKITFAGAGIAFAAMSKANIKLVSSRLSIRTIGYDKINQLRHVRYFKNTKNIYDHMRLHANILRPKFKLVDDILSARLSGTGIASWTKPNGGYFISLDLMPGTAKRTWSLAKDAGVILTNVGATFPYGKDPADSNIRIAPTNVTLNELETALEVLCVCSKIAACEKLLSNK
ncbi:MAG: aminotransferase class I/II-fold pyridoxal phosphate-dependent enzyme [Oscillospiraceae bacterium]|nr:aminotransferase class I/II-fold pyridoxal phosphate-dependent enzyme [Oscillospiraceae bacterium]